MARKPPATRAAIVLRTCPMPLFRAVGGITAPMKLALGRHCSRRQRDQSDCLRAGPSSTACARPSDPEMQEGWRSNLPSGAMANAAFSPPCPVTIASGGARLGRRLLDRHPPAERALAPGIEAEGRNAEGGSVHESPARGACPARAPHLPAPFSPYYVCREKGFSDASAGLICRKIHKRW